MKKKPIVVYLVDHKKRDLYMAGLIANRLGTLGIECHMEPLEATTAVLGRYQPDMIIFNHLLGRHLVAYSQRLHKLGVLIAVLPNEGILYKQEALEFNAGKYHNEAVIDLFLCWNEAHRDALLKAGFENTRIEVVGIPRFDYYFPPWSRLYAQPKEKNTYGRPQILVCTNFAFALYAELPKWEADKVFRHWAKHVPDYEDYWGAIQVQERNRKHLFDFLMPLIDSEKYDITLRPHPREDSAFYREQMDRLTDRQRGYIHLDHERNITDLILNCDLEISMDSCTTALESWIAGKPTVEFVMERHPLLSHDILDGLNVECSNPETVLSVVERTLAEPSQSDKRIPRENHLARWCNTPDGHSTEHVAAVIKEILSHKGRTGNLTGGLSFQDRKKALKLRLLSAMDKPYGWQPWLWLRELLEDSHAPVKRQIQDKAIRPSDAAFIRQQLSRPD